MLTLFLSYCTVIIAAVEMILYFIVRQQHFLPKTPGVTDKSVGEDIDASFQGGVIGIPLVAEKDCIGSSTGFFRWIHFFTNLIFEDPMLSPSYFSAPVVKAEQLFYLYGKLHYSQVLKYLVML